MRAAAHSGAAYSGAANSGPANSGPDHASTPNARTCYDGSTNAGSARRRVRRLPRDKI